MRGLHGDLPGPARRGRRHAVGGLGRPRAGPGTSGPSRIHASPGPGCSAGGRRAGPGPTAGATAARTGPPAGTSATATAGSRGPGAAGGAGARSAAALSARVRSGRAVGSGSVGCPGGAYLAVYAG